MSFVFFRIKLCQVFLQMNSTHCNLSELRENFELFFFCLVAFFFNAVKEQQLVVNCKREDWQSYVLVR